MLEKKIIYSLDQIDQAVNLLISLFDKCSVFAFHGDLGAGKTTLIKKILKQVGVKELITSPTFTYVSIYQNAKGQTFYHFDLYRIKTLQEFIDLGFNEYLYTENSWSFIEWPEVIAPLIKTKACHVYLDYHEDKRILTAKIL